MGDIETARSVPWHNEEALKSDYFRMMQLKIRPCPLAHEIHDWKLCPLAHPLEKARRRCPAIVRHSAATCPSFRKGGACTRSATCQFAHGVLEIWLHPSRYRTKMCLEGADCKRPVCFFAHSEAELREPTPFHEIAALKARLAEESQQAVDAALERIGLGAERASQVCNLDTQVHSASLYGCLPTSSSATFEPSASGLAAATHVHSDMRRQSSCLDTQAIVVAASLAALDAPVRHSSATETHGVLRTQSLPWNNAVQPSYAKPLAVTSTTTAYSSSLSLPSTFCPPVKTGTLQPRSLSLHSIDEALVASYLRQAAALQSNRGSADTDPRLSTPQQLSDSSAPALGTQNTFMHAPPANMWDSQGLQMLAMSAGQGRPDILPALGYNSAQNQAHGALNLTGNACVSLPSNCPPMSGGVGFAPLGIGRLGSDPGFWDYGSGGYASMDRAASLGSLPPINCTQTGNAGSGRYQAGSSQLAGAVWAARPPGWSLDGELLSRDLYNFAAAYRTQQGSALPRR